MNDLTTLFSGMPDDARLWIYTTDRALDDAAIRHIRTHFEDFISGWHSHGRRVTAAFDIVYNRFLMLAALIPGAEISGCGIDASVHALDRIAETHGFSIVPGLYVLYRNADGHIESASRPDFRRMVREGTVNGDTIVFDPSLTRVGDLRQGRFELPASTSWHATVFRIPDPEAAP